AGFELARALALAVAAARAVALVVFHAAGAVAGAAARARALRRDLQLAASAAGALAFEVRRRARALEHAAALDASRRLDLAASLAVHVHLGRRDLAFAASLGLDRGLRGDGALGRRRAHDEVALEPILRLDLGDDRGRVRVCLEPERSADLGELRFDVVCHRVRRRGELHDRTEERVHLRDSGNRGIALDDALARAGEPTFLRELLAGGTERIVLLGTGRNCGEGDDRAQQRGAPEVDRILHSTLLVFVKKRPLAGAAPFAAKGSRKRERQAISSDLRA